MIPPGPEDPRPSQARTWIRPGVLLPLIGALFLAVILLEPRESDDFGQTFHLTTHSTGQFGAAGLYEVMTRLGWRTSRRKSPFAGEGEALDTGTVYVLLAPSVPLLDSEDSALVHLVRAGGRVLLVSPDSAFTSMFGVWPSLDTNRVGYHPGISVAGDDGGIVPKHDPEDEIAMLEGRSSFPNHLIVRAAPPVDSPVAIFIWRSMHQTDHQPDSATAAPLMLGRQLGHGRVVLLGNPSLVANMAARNGISILAVQRALEWLAPAERRVVFDEYHQGYQTGKKSELDVIAAALTDTVPGWVTLQIAAAALILLVAVGVRPILPIPTAIVQRRSSLEHVDALARAYSAIHATRLGTQRLVRGLRRRHPFGRRGGDGSDEASVAYIKSVQGRYPVAKDDVDAIVTAIHQPVSDEQFVNVGQAIGRIEHTMHTHT